MTRRSERPLTAGDAARDHYYGISPIHAPHWTWAITWYFFFGGLAGASSALAALATLAGRRDPARRQIARAARYVSFGSLLPSPFLLVADLGRPERFWRMLSILKLRSPMSVGSWVLFLFSPLCGLTALSQAARDGLLGRTPAARLLARTPLRFLAPPSLLLGLALSGYTGVLLAATAVPLWTRNHLLMGPLFLASSFSNACSATALLLVADRRASLAALRRLDRLERVALLAEAALLLVHQARLGPVLRRPLERGSLGRAHRFGVLGLGLALPLALSALPASRLRTVCSSTGVLLGGVSFRHVMVTAGHASANDPAATFALTGRSNLPG